MRLDWIPGEYWYGGAVHRGAICDNGGDGGQNGRQPIGQGDIVEVNLNLNTTPNQAAPFFLSSKGRFLWREEGFSIRFDRGGISVPDDVETGEGFGSLRGAYREGMQRHFPFHPFTLAWDLFDKPIYNTWIELTFYQSQQAVLDYARGILKHGMEPGVLMIDDGWSECYGDWRFHSGKFPDPAGMIRELKQLGFSVMVWVCPFVTPDSVVWREAQKKGILVEGADGKPCLAEWWNGHSGVLDFSKPEAVTWFDRQMRALQGLGVDGFKFDGGDSVYYPEGKISRNEQSRLWAAYGERYAYNEYRVTWKAGGYALLQRLCDKEHSWGDKGIGALVPDTLLQGLTGHPYCCPDMVGGGEYLDFEDKKPGDLDQELFLCHSEIACLMPAIQFSAAPWRVLSEENLGRLKEQLALRTFYRKERVEALRQAAEQGEPIIRHMEYAFPGQGLERVMDQFMMGDHLLVAPCIRKGEAGREVVLPAGRWRYRDQILEGGQRLYLCKHTAAPIVLEYEGIGSKP